MQTEHISAVRSFNRAVTQRVGALNSNFLDRGRPLAEARLLYEIGRDGSDVSALREKLALDSGYLSRLLRSLERQGLVRTRPSAGDRRGRFVEPTREGRDEMAEYDRRSDGFAEALLLPLSTAQRDRLVAAMSEVERLMRAASVQFRAEKPNGAVARQCLAAYFQELSERFPEGFDPAKSLAARPEDLTLPAGYFVVALLHGVPVGCGAVKVWDGIGEIKRMWVAPEARGIGIGRRLLGVLEDHASRFGAKTVRLETHEALKEAHNLYRTSGYREAPPFNDEPYAHLWFEKTLSS
jgi:DNA-binding MarR family transcriptional regulator/GNAT superfamily N-acetyltransferase